MYYHLIATLPAGRKKSIVNKLEADILPKYVIPFVSSGVITEKWGASKQTYQAHEIAIYRTQDPWNKKSKTSLEQFLKGQKNRYLYYRKQAQDLLGKQKHRVFIVMPIQGEKYGTQDDQRIYREYDERFEKIEKTISKFDCIAIRIDKEHPIGGLVNRIKAEIQNAKFIIGDLTDERPSCYFEVGYAEALQRPVIYISSKNSVIDPKKPTKIHFDIHDNVNFFVNHDELKEKIETALHKNKAKLFNVSEAAKIEKAD